MGAAGMPPRKLGVSSPFDAALKALTTVPECRPQHYAATPIVTVAVYPAETLPLKLGVSAAITAALLSPNTLSEDRLIERKLLTLEL